MAMTERQGGSDVRANITRAEPVGDGSYELHGHKWFCSYPPCDVFLVLAQAPGRPLVLPGRARPGDGVPAAQGQARHAVVAVLRGRVPRRPRPAGRRGGPRGAGDHPDGQPHPARLPARRAPRAMRRGDARGDPPRPPSRARSARCSSTSRRCATCSPTSRSSPRRRPRAAMRVARAYDEPRQRPRSGGSRPRS